LPHAAVEPDVIEEKIYAQGVGVVPRDHRLGL
jgi:hypothetical protein